MKSFTLFASVAALLTGSSVAHPPGDTNASTIYTTVVSTAYSTLCPGPTMLPIGHVTYTCERSTLLTIKHCPCTLANDDDKQRPDAPAHTQPPPPPQGYSLPTSKQPTPMPLAPSAGQLAQPYPPVHSAMPQPQPSAPQPTPQPQSQSQSQSQPRPQAPAGEPPSEPQPPADQPKPQPQPQPPANQPQSQPQGPANPDQPQATDSVAPAPSSSPGQSQVVSTAGADKVGVGLGALAMVGFAVMLA